MFSQMTRAAERFDFVLPVRACATTLVLSGAEAFAGFLVFLGTRKCRGGNAKGARQRRAPFSIRPDYLRCLLTSFVISNIETLPLPPKTALSLSSALIMRRSLASWRPFRLMYCQSFFVTSVRGMALLPTTAPSAGEICIGLMKAAFGVRFL